MATSVRSFCKINLGLAVGPLRPDGYHGLATAYQTLALYDVVRVAARLAVSTEISIESNHAAVPSTALGNAERNTAFKIVNGALRRLGLTAEVKISIQKQLPVQGGLGAGSANAAAALLGLERELNVALGGPERLLLAAEVGSDVPLFLLGGTVLGLDRGQAVFPLPDSPAVPVVVAVPSVGVSTAQAFRDLDAQMGAAGTGRHGDSPSGLTASAPTDRLEQLSRVLASVWTPTGDGRETTGIAKTSPSQSSGPSPLEHGNQPNGMDASESAHGHQGDLAEESGLPNRLRFGMLNPLLALVRTGIENDFESVAFRQHPSLRVTKQALLGENSGSSDAGASQALYAALSGSGSALFGVYSTIEAAREAQQRVQSLGTRAFLTETLPRSEYWRRMFA